ncbi:MAG: hypothetical protein KJ970_11240 [Candidatus Eisenbacteria bacterium]|uniref:Lipocalin-like domain-containing protein n=1 Tax=Eiseniibacteriota bacterium TaxID=2212470 RepID=A0A948RVY5_UNCEI|nr:hypothetical protein [Candidatus Eisenbacteria bacterium]MBU1949186.1 hypothetical protein [Candidatus Eisenbacteria bacterium]MBU2691491.1 hypothetical protein [Candidatus Eisenbacteria bacterium]
MRYFSSAIILLSLLTIVGCSGDGGDGGTNPGHENPANSEVIGVWATSSQYGEHTLYFDENQRWLDVSTTFVSLPDFDPYQPDPVWLVQSGVDGGTYQISAGSITFTYWDDERSESFIFETEDYSTQTKDDDLLTLGSRYYLYESAITELIQDPVPIETIDITTTDNDESFPFNTYSTDGSQWETDFFGTSPVTLLFVSMGGHHLEVRIGDRDWITLGEMIPFDGYRTLGVHAYFNNRDGIWEILADRSEGGVTFTKFDTSQNGIVIVSGTIDGAVLYDTLDFSGESLTLNASFEDLECLVEE